MVPFQNRDERLKIITYITITLIFQGIIFFAIYYSSITKINNKIINQNFAIVDKLNKKDKNIINEILPIITGREKLSDESVNNGEAILKEYSYTTNLSYKDNPLIGNIEIKDIALIVAATLGILGLIIYGFIYLINPLYKEIKYLTYRAENIIENRHIEKERSFKYSGSLDKFIIKFYTMEERIYNNIGLLQEEKINLKNIINDISHQLKTPLMALSMYNDILKDHREMENDDVDNFINLSNE